MAKNGFLVSSKSKETPAMHVKRFLHKLLSPVMHISRINTLSHAVHAAIIAKDLTLTGLGRAIDLPIQERSGIQKINRLIGNEKLLLDYKSICQSISELLIGKIFQPEIIIDWSKYPKSGDAILRAAFAAEGRALTLYEERHPIKKMGNKKIQNLFLKKLNEILPKDCRPIIITDAGFHNDWFKEVLCFGWDYIGRVRGIRKYRLLDKERFMHCRNLFKQATKKPKALGKMVLTRGNPTENYFYIVKKKLKGRKALTKSGKVKKDKDSKTYSRGNREPWLLVSSLKGRHAAHKVVEIYSRRMTIEEAFRDLKSSKYGLGLSEGKTRIKKRRNILLLIAMLASLIAWCAGVAGEKMKLQYQFQSNSIKHRRVLSLFYLGCQLIKRNFKFSMASSWDIFASLKNEAIYG